MQLSSFTDYGLRILLYLANLSDDKVTSVRTISNFYKLSHNHLIKVAHRLVKLGYVESVQGKYGGLRLNKKPNAIYIGSVVRDLEPLQLLNCSEEFCNITSYCRLKRKLIEAKQAFLECLDEITLEDLIVGNTDLANYINISVADEIEADYLVNR